MRISGITYAHRRPRKNRKVIVVLALFAVLIIALASVSFYAGWNITHPDREALALPVSNTSLKPRDIKFSDKNKDVTLKGWYFSAKNSKKTVIIAHGYGTNRLAVKEKTYGMINSFINNGYNVLTFDFRNSGESGGNTTTVGIKEKYDLLGAIDYAKAHGSKDIILIGFSMGAATSITTAAESKDVDAVIADSPFADLREYLDDNLPLWSHLPSVPFNKTVLWAAQLISGVDPSDFSPRKVIPKIAPRPVLLIHSKDDKSIPYQESEELLKAAGGNAEIWLTSKANHIGSYTMSPDDYMNRVFTFLDKVLKEEK